MFYSASAFNQDIGNWTGTAATTAQSNMFSGATAFQAKYTCGTSGPASSCDTIKSTWVAPSPPPSPPPPGVGYTCIANMGPFLNALALAQEDVTNVENAIAMCGLAQGYYGNYCMNDPTVIETVATNPTLYGAATSSTVNAGVSANCATGGIAVRAHTPDQKTQHETCASNYDDYRDKCYVVIGIWGAGATPTAAEVFACCTAANVMALNACPCVNVEDGYGVDRSIASTTDIRLDFILNAPGSGCVGRTRCFFHSEYVHVQLTVRPRVRAHPVRVDYQVHRERELARSFVEACLELKQAQK